MLLRYTARTPFIYWKEIMSGGEDTPPVVTIVDSNSTTPLLSTVSIETMNDEGGDEEETAAGGGMLTFKDVDFMIQTSFKDVEANHSAICDIMAMYLKGQKMLYTEAKTVCEQRLHCLMLPAIFITSVCTILSLALKDLSYGATVISSLSGVNAFILAVVSYMKLDAKAEAHRMSAYKFDKMESILVFNSGKMLYIPNATEEMETILKTTEKNIREVKEANQFGLPEYVRYNYPHLYSMNVFAEVKKIHYIEMGYVNDLKDALNDIMLLKQKDTPRTPLEETKLEDLQKTQRTLVSNIIALKDDYLTIDNQFEHELHRARNRVHWCPSPCDWLKT